MIDYGKFELSLKRLEERHANHRRDNPARPDLDREGIAESVIRRFGTCYDCLWKVLRRHLVERLGIADPPNSPKPVFRIAFESQLFPPPPERWLRYADARTDTSHDCDGGKARACLKLVPDFIGDAIDLHGAMTGRAWR